MTRFSKITRAVAGGLVLSLCLSFCGFTGECDQIRDRVLRLHILANSDSTEDQQLKLKVRDTVVKTAADIFDPAANVDDAIKIAEEKLPQIEAAAQQRVYDEGYHYEVHARLLKMYFNTRKYDTVTLPAGLYNALRITIGSGKGKNWWCVVFPPICVAAASDAAEMKDVLNPDQENIVTDSSKYVIRFKIVEIFEEIEKQLQEWFGGES